jgi:RNA polymerase sigma-70 factor (ECF subfamily)
MRTTCTLPAQLETCPKASIRKTSDVDLIEAIAMGDRQALGTLFARYHVRIYRFIVRFTGNASVAEDVVSEVFIAVWRAAGGFKKTCQVSTWLLAIARYKAIEALKRTPHEQLDDQMAMNALVAADDPEASANESSRRSIIQKCLMQLTTTQREILDLIYYHERTPEQVAEIAGIPRGTVKTRAFYARRRLAELLRDVGINEANP